MAPDRQQGISNHPVDEEVERQRKLPRRGTDREGDTAPSQVDDDRNTAEENLRRQDQRRSPA